MRRGNGNDEIVRVKNERKGDFLGDEKVDLLRGGYLSSIRMRKDCHVVLCH